MKNVEKPSTEHRITPDTRFEYTQIAVRHDESQKVAWCHMYGIPRPCFTQTLLTENLDYFHYLSNQSDEDLSYLVHASKSPGTYSFGGDLQLFIQLIRNKDKESLFKYAKSCVDGIYAKTIHFNRDITVISLVQGDALGGGFECALACDILIAERDAKMGFPEILFNLFPGMGAYTLLSRRIGGAKADRVILGGTLYTAEQLYEMGVIDILAEEGRGEQAVYEYIKKENRYKNGYRSYREIRHIFDPISYEELIGITRIWVDAALRLEPRDIRMMERLVSRQTEKNHLQVHDGKLTNAHGSAQG